SCGRRFRPKPCSSNKCAATRSSTPRSKTSAHRCLAVMYCGVLTRFNRWTQHLMEVLSMGRPPGWAAALTGRAVMLSPGRPPVRRDLERAFWVQIARGLTSEDAAGACGVSSPVGSRWFRHAGGMPPIELAPVSGRYLSFSEREDIAVLRAQGISMRQIAIRIKRPPSTISRELRRNAATRNGKLEYRASIAQWKADLAARRPKTAKLVEHEHLREYVQDKLSGVIRDCDGNVVGLFASWKGRNKPRRADRRWATAW